jgi:hypothetical protein
MRLVSGKLRSEKPFLKALEQRWTKNRRKKAMLSNEVIAWDGEGWGKPRHVYGLLANSLGSLLLTDNTHRSLRTLPILDLIWRTGVAHQEAYQVTYGGTYDWNHWLNDIDMRTAQAIHNKNPVSLGDFQVVYNGVWFEVRKSGYWITIWDVWRLWNCGFAQAVKETWPDFHGLRKIEEFKQYRDRFQELVDAGRMDEIIEYNNLELEALVGILQRAFKYFEDARIRRPSALTGSGATAGSLIVQHQVTQYVEPPPDEVKPAVLGANFGGRIEAWKYGVGPIVSHDIRSAYPTALRYVPNLRGGKWTWYDGDYLADDWDQRFSVWKIRWGYAYTDGMDTPTHRGYPFAFRDHGGSVLFPPSGKGWQWWPEVITARSLGFEFEIIGGWVFEPVNSKLPFSWMDTRYEQRRLLKVAGNEGASRLLKNGINATWGKTAQARGFTELNPPQHHSLAWAGWVTSHCRATIFEAASQDWDSVIYMMTDSVASTRRFDLPEGDALGEWEIKEYDKGMVLQAGVAFLWDESGKRIDKFRGFDKDSINPDAIIQAWKDNQIAKERKTLQVPSSRPVTLGSALVNEEWFEKWNTWQEHLRELDIYGGDGKRWAPNWLLDTPWQGFEDLQPWGMMVLDAEMESAPFEPKWEETSSHDRVLIEGVLRDTVDDETVVGALA